MNKFALRTKVPILRYIQDMINGPKLAPNQWKLLASAISNISQAIILFGLAALFVPRSLNLEGNFSKEFAFLILIWGLALLIGAVIIVKRGKEND